MKIFEKNLMLYIGFFSAVFSIFLGQNACAADFKKITNYQQNEQEIIKIDFSEELSVEPKMFVIQSPPRIAIDFVGGNLEEQRQNFEINSAHAKTATVVQADGRLRVVIALKKMVSSDLKKNGKSFYLRFNAESNQEIGGISENSSAIDVPFLKDIDFKRTSDATGRVIIDLPNEKVNVNVQQKGMFIEAELSNVQIPAGLIKKLDVTDFGTPVQTIAVNKIDGKNKIIISPKGNWEYSSYQNDNRFVIEVRANKKTDGKEAGAEFFGEKLSLNFQNIEVRSLLQVIADFTNFNIVTSDSVVGAVTLRLKDVPWDQALDIILQSKNLGMKKTGNVIWIAPRDEIAAKEKAELEAKAAVEGLEPVKTQSFQMNYAKAVDIAAQLAVSQSSSGAGGVAVSQGLLSPRGRAIAEPRTNQLFVTDVPNRLQQVAEFIAKLDVPVRQVLIEARIVEADDKFSRSLGVRLGGADLRGVRGGDAGYSLGGGNRLALGGTYDAINTTTGAGSNALTTTNTTFYNLPASGLGGASPATFALSLFNSSANRYLNLELSALEADGRGKIVSSPRVVTADQVKAIIEQGVEYPYQTAAASGATTLSFRRAGLKLEVTPQITPEGNIILDVQVNKDSPGEILLGARAINTKRVQTQVLVENGGTVVIGGIFESEEQDSENKVPLLADIPIFGNLFKSRNRTSNKSELLVFITPKVVSTKDFVRN
jgi:type IV pilus assembly protein PilQ